MPAVNYDRIPVYLEPEVLQKLEETAAKIGINRTKLMRMCIKYVLANPSVLRTVISTGDPP